MTNKLFVKSKIKVRIFAFWGNNFGLIILKLSSFYFLNIYSETK